MSAYQTVATAIQGVLPAAWRFDDYEAPNGPVSPDTTTVELKIRAVRRLPGAPIGSYQIDWVATITTQYPDREVADTSLYDDLIDFLGSLDGIGSWLGWTDATKAVNEDGRLAYDITIQTHTSKEEA